MKALLLKDYYVLKKSFWLFLFCSLTFQLIPGSGILILTLYAVLLPSSAFAYDDRSRWGELAAMLPYSEWDIVLSRYALSWISILVFNLAGVLGRIAVGMALPDFLEGELVDLTGVLNLMALSSIFVSLLLPIYFRFDAEKSRAIRLVSVVFLCGIGGGAIGFVYGNERSFPSLFWGILIVAVVLTAVSVPLSRLAYRARHK